MKNKMIFTNRTITVRKGESRIDEPIVVYRGDYELEVRFTILNSKFKFKSGTNMIETEKASYGQLAILTPYGGNIFSDIVKCNDGSVTFVLTADMLNQIEEVGLYSFQIRLMDYNKESRVSIPPIEFGIEVREPIASEDHDNSVNNAIVGYSIAKVVDPKEENVGDTFDEDGDYNKTKWETGDRISEGKLNKIEDALDEINRNEKNAVATLDKRIISNYNILDSKIDEVATKGTTVDVIEQVTKDEIERQIDDGTIANLTIEDHSITSNKYGLGSVGYNQLDPTITNMLQPKIELSVDLLNTDVFSPYIVGNNIYIDDPITSSGDFNNIFFDSSVRRVTFVVSSANRFVSVGGQNKYISITLLPQNIPDQVLCGYGVNNMQFTAHDTCGGDALPDKPNRVIPNGTPVTIDLTSDSVITIYTNEVSKENIWWRLDLKQIPALSGYYEENNIGILWGGSRSQLNKDLVASDVFMLSDGIDAKLQHLESEMADIQEDIIVNGLGPLDEDDTIVSNGRSLVIVDDTYSLDTVDVPSVLNYIYIDDSINNIEFTIERSIYWVKMGDDSAGNDIVFGFSETLFIGQIASINTVNNRIGSIIRDGNKIFLLNSGIYAIGKRARIEIVGDTIVCSVEDGGEFVPSIMISYNDYNSYSVHRQLGFYIGISDFETEGALLFTDPRVKGNHSIGSMVIDLNEKVQELENSMDGIGETSNSKLAVLCVAGQSNAVGYDESPLEYRFTYRNNRRLKQLGFHTDNLKIIPLNHCAQSFQDMRAFGNPSNPADRPGTKGVHLPLATLLLDVIPDDYDIVVIPAAFGGTGFTIGTTGTYNSDTMKPMNGTQHGGIQWGSSSPYFYAMRDRIKYCLDKNDENIFLGVIWIQGEHDSSNPATHWTGFTAMTDAFFAYFNDNGYGGRVKKGVWDKDIWYNVETTYQWYDKPGCVTIWNNYKTWSPDTYVEVPRDTDTNAVNGTGSTTFNRPAHFGNNAYYKVVAPNIFEKMKENGNSF